MDNKITAEINNKVWTFSIDKPTNEIFKLHNKYLDSVCEYRTRTIHIKDTVSLNDLAHILNHEICHALIYETQIKTVDVTYTEEDLCEFVGKYFESIVNIYNLVITKINDYVKHNI